MLRHAAAGIALALLAHVHAAAQPVLEVHAGTTRPPDAYATGLSLSLSGSLTANRRWQLRVDHMRVSADADGGYGQVVPDARRSVTSLLLLLNAGGVPPVRSGYLRPYLGGGYSFTRERGTSVVGGASAAGSDHGFAMAGGLKLGYAWADNLSVELEPGMLLVRSDPYHTSSAFARFAQLRLGVVRRF